MRYIQLALLTICLLQLANCKTSKQSTYENEIKAAYVYGFKMAYFKRLLLEGFNHSAEIKTVLQKDASKGLADMPLTLDDWHIIDSLAKAGNAQMRKDSIRNINRAEGAQGKYIFSFALDQFNSKQLDSLAKARQKIFAH